MRAKRTDGNQRQMAQIFRDAGFSVFVTSSLGCGYPDLSIGYREKNYLIEIKDGEKPKSAQRLTPDEAKFFSEWKGQALVISGEEEARKFIKRVKGRK